jgi:hypothetical protein
VIGVLKAAFMQGMLAKDEFDLRAGQRPREAADLSALPPSPGGAGANLIDPA